MPSIHTWPTNLLFGVLCCLALPDAVHADIVGGPIYDPNTNMNLYVLSPQTWTQSEAEAQSLGGNLVTIPNATDNAFIVSNVLQNFSSSGGPNLSNVPVWIGLYDPTGAANPNGDSSTHAADFVWVDGSTSTYRNWSPGEPNDYAGVEFYTAINWHYADGTDSAPGAWDDTPVSGIGGGNTTGPYYGIAEVSSVPEPTSFCLVGLGVLGTTVTGVCTRGRKKVA